MHRLALPLAFVLLPLVLLASCAAPAPSSQPAPPTPPPTVTHTPQPTPPVPTATLTAAPSIAPATPTASPTVAAPTPGTSGLRIVYFKDGYVMLWTERPGSSGPPTATALTQASPERLRISDDGQVIAYHGRDEAGGYGLFAVGADGTGRRLLVGQDDLAKLQPAATMIGDFGFAPGTHILYLVTDQYDLQRVNSEDGEIEAVLPAGKGGFFSFSPDGQWMALYHPNELALTRPDGTEGRTAIPYPDDYRFTMMGPEIIWSPDSSGFYSVAASGPQGTPDNMTVWFVPVEGDAVAQMVYTGPYGSHLSPDGRQVGYAMYQHEPIDVHIVGADGTDTTYGAYDSKAYPAFKFMGWAPDSTRFLLDLSADGRIVVPHLCALGEPPTRLTDTEDAYPLAWVDAQRIVFISGGPSGQRLRLQRLGEPSVVLDEVHSGEFAFVDLGP